MYKLNIPEKINVGFQNRIDTYTGKLAFIVYTDEKGVLRKERSWDNWRDHKIEPQEFENIPTEGFVLNKKVGDRGYGWYSRRAWTRIYDPRGFEFEIDIENLIFILEEYSSIKGKGLEGEFVYAWDGAKLVLLPVSSQEYKKSLSFQEACKKKVTKTDIKEGLCYITKDGDEVMYLGRLPFWELTGKNNTLEYRSKRKHIFTYLNKEKTKSDKYTKLIYKNANPIRYFVQSGFTKILSKLNDEPHPNFAEEFDKYKKSKYGSAPVKVLTDGKPESYYDSGFVKTGNEIYYSRKNDVYPGYYTGHSKTTIYIAKRPIRLTEGKSLTIPVEFGNYPSSLSKHETAKIQSLYIITESGLKLKIA